MVKIIADSVQIETLGFLDAKNIGVKGNLEGF